MTHGGKRAGAGRKPGARSLVTRTKAEGILEAVNEERVWQRLLRSPNDRIVLDAMKYLTDRRDGKPVQAIKADVALGSLAERLAAARRRVASTEQEEERPSSLLVTTNPDSLGRPHHP
jgi:hypothetical protein